jgi:hypothetical protein
VKGKRLGRPGTGEVIWSDWSKCFPFHVDRIMTVTSILNAPRGLRIRAISQSGCVSVASARTMYQGRTDSKQRSDINA